MCHFLAGKPTSKIAPHPCAGAVLISISYVCERMVCYFKEYSIIFIFLQFLLHVYNFTPINVCNYLQLFTIFFLGFPLLILKFQPLGFRNLALFIWAVCLSKILGMSSLFVLGLATLLASVDQPHLFGGWKALCPCFFRLLLQGFGLPLSPRCCSWH